MRKAARPSTALDAPADYPQYWPVYYAVVFADPDGLKLEFVHMA
jgi:glyoxylase I family protein